MSAVLYPHGSTYCTGCPSCQPDRFPRNDATVVSISVEGASTVGGVCKCGRAFAGFSGTVIVCPGCGALHLVSSMQIAGPAA